MVQFNSVHSQKLGEQGVWILCAVAKIVWQYYKIAINGTIRGHQYKTRSSSFMPITKSPIESLLTTSQEFALSVRHCLDHVFAVTGIEKELATFGVGDELNEIGIPTNRKQEVKLVHAKHPSQVGKGHGSVIFEFECMR